MVGDRQDRLGVRFFYVGGTPPRCLGDIVRRLYRDEVVARLGVALVEMIALKGEFPDSGWRRLSRSVLGREDPSAWRSARTPLIEVGIIQRDGSIYEFSNEFAVFLSACVSILLHAFSGAHPPILTIESKGIDAICGEFDEETLGQDQDATSGSIEGVNSRDGEVAGCSSGSSVSDSEPGKIFSQLARKMGVTAEAVRKMCVDATEKEGLPISPEEYAEAYLASL